MVGGSKGIRARAVALFVLLCLVISPSRARSIETARELMRWMRANGATVNVDVADMGNGRFGAVAAKDLKTDDTLFYLPPWMSITSRVAAQQGPYPGILEEMGWNETGPQEHGDFFNAHVLFLVYHRYVLPEMQCCGAYQPFIDALPSDYREHPLMWSEEITQSILLGQLIRGSRILAIETCELLLEEVKLRWSSGQRDLAPEDFTISRCLWAGLVMRTRSWEYESDYILAPGADLFDHGNGNKSAILVPYRNKEDPRDVHYSLELRAASDAKQGDELYISYGARTTSKMLVTYGYIPMDAPLVVFIPLFINPNQSVEKQLIADYLENMNVEITNGWLPGIAPLDEPSSNIIIFGRLFNLLEVSSLDVLNEVMMGEPVSLHHEIKSLHMSWRSLQNLQRMHFEKERHVKNADDPMRVKKLVTLWRMMEIRVLRAQSAFIQKEWDRLIDNGPRNVGAWVFDRTEEREKGPQWLRDRKAKTNAAVEWMEPLNLAAEQQHRFHTTLEGMEYAFAGGESVKIDRGTVSEQQSHLEQSGQQQAGVIKPLEEQQRETQEEVWSSHETGRVGVDAGASEDEHREQERRKGRSNEEQREKKQEEVRALEEPGRSEHVELEKRQKEKVDGVPEEQQDEVGGGSEERQGEAKALEEPRIWFE